MQESIKLLDLNIINQNLSEVLDEIDQCIRAGIKKIYFPLNVDMVVKSYRDADFNNILKQNDSLLADGVPIIWAAKFLGKRIKEKISGSDLFPKVCEFAAQRKYKVFFLGAEPGVVLKAGEILKRKNANLNIVCTYSPFFGFEKSEAENNKIINIINSSHPDILFIGFGAPKQEIWIWKHKDAINTKITICIGAGFDFVAGKITRAPLWMQKAGLEWFWRLMKEPGRLWKRYLIDDMIFFWLVLKQKIIGIKTKNFTHC